MIRLEFVLRYYRFPISINTCLKLHNFPFLFNLLSVGLYRNVRHRKLFTIFQPNNECSPLLQFKLSIITRTDPNYLCSFSSLKVAVQQFRCRISEDRLTTRPAPDYEEKMAQIFRVLGSLLGHQTDGEYKYEDICCSLQTLYLYTV